MQLFHASLFSDKSPGVQSGWNFFKGSLEIKNPDGSTSLFGHIKNSCVDDRITMYDGYLNNKHPHFLEKDLRPDQTSNHFLLTIVSDGFMDLSKSFGKNRGHVRMGPKRKKDKSLVLTTLCLPKDEIFFITVQNPNDTKKTEVLIRFVSFLNLLIVEDVNQNIIKPTLTMKAVRFFLKTFFKRRGVFGHF